ncbi:Ig-like domain-containing protein, partial [Arcobacter cloacae]
AESTLNHQNQPSVDALEEGGFVVSWTGYNAESKTYDIFTQRYTNDGVKIIRTTDFVINEDEVFKVNTKVLLANDIDAEGDKFDIVSVQDAKDGKVELITLSNGEKEVVFTPKEGYFGKTSFTYTIEDEHGATDTATVTFEVLSDGINDRVYHLEENESVDIDELKQADILDMSNNSKDNVKINLEDIILDNDSHKELVIKGEIGDIIELDKPATDWVKGQTQQIDGKNYNVYTNATVKLLIEDDIDVKPDI